MTKINYQQAQFLTSAATFQQCPPDQGKEVAFAGRSNAGKSSALNALANIKSLARTSKLPGRTQLINFFVLNEHTRLVDLPGYGYAKVPEAIKQRWQKTLAHYLEKRESLCGIVLLMDIRHPLKASDEQMLTWASHSNLPVHILLTKADKLSKSAGVKVLQQLKKQLNISENISLQLFSALKKTGIEELQKKMDEWLEV